MQRDEIPDGLKVLALLGVFMVNGLGYALAPYYPLQLGAPIPIDSAWAQTIHAVTLTLFMGKALPFLAFLFGYSMTSYSMRCAQPKALKSRQYKLLLIGVLHGALLYFGDILTSYALIALWFGSTTTARGRVVIKRWQGLFVLSALLIAFKLWMEWKNYLPTLEPSPDDVPDALALAQSGSYVQFLSANATGYLASMVGWLLSYYVPLHICLFITGILAARYRWLSLQARLPRLFFCTGLYRSWWLALLANGLLAIASVHMHRQYGLRGNVGWIALLNVPLGVWLAASGLIRLMRHIQNRQSIPNWILWLAPAGRHTLAMYLGLSATLVLCGRFGLFTSTSSWNHTAVWLTALLLMWLGAVWLGRGATARQMRDPISKWLSL